MPDSAGPLCVVIVDDEPLARSTLRILLEGDPDVGRILECCDGEEALNAISNSSPELIFLDVQMPGISGFDVLKRLPPMQQPLVIFTTAFGRYALRAFDEHAVDYLLKPFDRSRFETALERAKQRLRSRSQPDAVTAATSSQPDRLSIHREGEIELINVEAIDWVESADQYVRLHMGPGEVLMRHSMQRLEADLGTELFMRIHRSAIVALRCVRKLETTHGGAGRVLLEDGTWLPVSRSRLPGLRKRLG